MFRGDADGGEDDYDFNFTLDEKTAAVPGTAAGSYNFGAKKSAANAQPASRMGTQGGSEARPLTSMAGAGFSSKNRTFDPLNQKSSTAATLVEKADNSAEDLAKEMEKQGECHLFTSCLRLHTYINTLARKHALAYMHAHIL